MAKKKRTGPQTMVGFRVKMSEALLWEQLCEKTGLNLSDLVKKAVELYLHTGMANPLKGVTLTQDLEKYARTGTKHINIRVDLGTLSEWDAFCEEHFISRVSLLRQAMASIMQPHGSYKPNFLFERACRRILYNVVKALGLIDYVTFSEIFDVIEPKSRVRMLNRLESDRLILRKGRDTYVPQEVRGPADPRFIIENLERIRSSSDEIDDSHHYRLMTVIFKYLEDYLGAKDLAGIAGKLRDIRDQIEEKLNVKLE
ncbi:MAG: hypothetical protein ACTSU5_13775 [Promethearchaeota archaeon]